MAVLVCLKILKIRAANKKNKEQEYHDRITVRKELLELLNQRYEKVNYTEQVIVTLVEFIMTILIVPDKLEKAFEKEFYEPFILKHQDMELSVQGKKYADMLTRAYFGRSIEETILKWKEERRLKEEAQQKLEAQQLEAQKLKEEAQQKLEAQQLEAQKLKKEAQQKLEAQKLEAQKLKEKQNHLIVSLRFEAGFEVEKIAKFLEIETTEVEKILQLHQEKKEKEK